MTAPKRTSDLLLDFAHRHAHERVTMAAIVSALGERGIGVLIAIFAIPNIIPSGIPGGTAVFGIPIMIFAGHLVFGYRHLVLPKFIGRRSLSANEFRAFARQLAKVLSWFERLLQPRFTAMTKGYIERVLGVACIVFAAVSSLPIPFGHNLPALALTLIGLGLIERDGVAILSGLVIGVVGLAVAGVIVLGLVHGLEFLRGWL